MSHLFQGAKGFNSNISRWNASSILNMDALFLDAFLFNSDIASWDTSKVTDMSWMFKRAHLFNGGLLTWNIKDVFIGNSMLIPFSSCASRTTKGLSAGTPNDSNRHSKHQKNCCVKAQVLWIEIIQQALPKPGLQRCF